MLQLLPEVLFNAESSTLSGCNVDTQVLVELTKLKLITCLLFFFFSGCASFFIYLFLLFIYLFIFKFYFIFKLYLIVLVLPNIKMNPPQVYMRPPSWTLSFKYQISVPPLFSSLNGKVKRIWGNKLFFTLGEKWKLKILFRNLFLKTK